MRVLLTGALVAGLTLTGCGTTQTDRAREVEKDAGKVQLGKFYMTMPDCSGAPFTLKVTQQGENGFAMIEKSKAEINVDDTVSGKVTASCAGKFVPAQRVVYIPNLDYVGPDSVKVYYENAANSELNKTIGYTINVK